MSTPSEEMNLLKVEDVVRAAVRALPSFLGGTPLRGVRVEEVFRPHQDSRWRVTLSHLEAGVEDPKNPVLAALEGPFKTPPPPERVFHVLEVDRSTGEVVSMRLREEPG